MICIYRYICNYLVGGFNHLEKYESQWEGLSHILWTIKKWNHQPVICIYYCIYHCIPEPGRNPTESGVMFTNFANMLPPLHPVAVKGSPFHVHSSAVRPSVYTQSPGCSRQFHLPQSWSKCWGDHPWSFNRNVRPPSDVSWFRFAPVTSSL